MNKTRIENIIIYDMHLIRFDFYFQENKKVKNDLMKSRTARKDLSSSHFAACFEGKFKINK